jgi:hypothetical protein
MARAIRELLSVQALGSGDTSRLSGWICEQKEASRAAGFVRVARLCETMNDCLAGLRGGERPALVPVVGALLDVCRTVQLHAEAVAQALRRARSGRAGKGNGETGVLANWKPRAEGAQ